MVLDDVTIEVPTFCITFSLVPYLDNSPDEENAYQQLASSTIEVDMTDMIGPTTTGAPATALPNAPPRCISD